MASLIYVTNNHVLSVKCLPLQFVSLLPPEPAVLTAIIRQHGEPTPELEEQTSLAWHEPLRVKNIEAIVAKNSEVELHDPTESDSEDSDALYFGKNDELGLLLQYLGPEAWRTNDAVAHTSVHHHEISRETYYLLDGAASIELRDFKTGGRREVPQTELRADQVGGHIRGFNVYPYTQHPVVASNSTHSVMFLVTKPANNTKDDHIYGGSFRDIFADVIAARTQKMRGPSAKG